MRLTEHHSTHVVTLIKSEVIYDIEYAAYRKHSAKANKDGETDNHAMKLKGNDADYVARKIETAVAELKQVLRFCMYEHQHHVSDALIDLPEGWNFVIKQSKVSRNNIQALAGMMHAYVVDWVLAEWFRVSSDRDTSLWSEYMQSANNYKQRCIEIAHADTLTEEPIFRL